MMNPVVAVQKLLLSVYSDTVGISNNSVHKILTEELEINKYLTHDNRKISKIQGI